MTACCLLVEASERGLTLSVRGDRLAVKPDDKLTAEFAQLLRSHKPELLRLLKLPFLIAYSEVLGQTIIFAENEATKEALVKSRAKPFSIYTKDELRILVAHNREKPFLPDQLRKLHEIKREFNGTVVPRHD